MFSSNPFSFVLGLRSIAPVRDAEMNDGSTTPTDEEMQDEVQVAQALARATDVHLIRDTRCAFIILICRRLQQVVIQRCPLSHH
jgi:hypothetical protein